MFRAGTLCSQVALGWSSAIHYARWCALLERLTAPSLGRVPIGVNAPQAPHGPQTPRCLLEATRNNNVSFVDAAPARSPPSTCLAWPSFVERYTLLELRKAQNGEHRGNPHRAEPRDTPRDLLEGSRSLGAPGQPHCGCQFAARGPPALYSSAGYCRRATSSCRALCKWRSGSGGGTRRHCLACSVSQPAGGERSGFRGGTQVGEGGGFLVHASAGPGAAVGMQVESGGDRWRGAGPSSGALSPAAAS